MKTLIEASGNLKIYKNNKLINEFKNMVLDTGLNIIIGRLISDTEYNKISKMVVGDGNVAVEATQTTIQGSYVNSNDITPNYNLDGTAMLEAEMTGAVGGETHWEIILCEDFTDFGVDNPKTYARILFPESVELLEAETINYVWEIVFKRKEVL